MQSFRRVIRWALVCTFLILAPVVTAFVIQPHAAFTYVVSTTSDSGPGSLRDAVLQANTNTAGCAGGCDIVFSSTVFNTPQTIQLTFTAVDITAPNVTIDGFVGSGSGATGSANTAAFGSPDNSVHNVIIGGPGTTCGCTGIRVNPSAASFKMRGVVMHSFATALNLNGPGAIIQGSFFGTDGGGVAPQPNLTGIVIGPQGTSNTIGGAAPSARNVISGNQTAGIAVTSSMGSPTGVEGNYIGPNRVLTAGLSNQTGIDAQLSPLIAVGNHISGNSIGVRLSSSGSNLQNNIIGVSSTLKNSGDGISITGFANTVFTNTISFNTGIGVAVSSGGQNRIITNAIHDNTGMGIDLMTGTFGAGRTLNDTGDADTGGNGLQNFPLINSAVVSASGTLTVNVSLDSPTPAVSNLVEYFEADGDPSFPEGKRYIDGFCFNTSDIASQSYSMPSSGITPGMRVVVAATSFSSISCTSPLDGTSEFSNAAIAANLAPTALADSTSTAEDTPVSLDPRINDTDPEGDALSIVSNTQPPVGTGTASCTAGSCTYTPPLNYFGTTSFNYTISDGAGNTATGTISVTVTPVNDQPVALNDTGTTAEDTAFTFDPRTNDSDPDGDPITINGSAGAVNGTVSCTTTSCTFTPAANFNGTGSFTYTITDGVLTSTPATVTVTVTPVNDPPVAVNDSITTAEDTPATIDPRANDTDVESDPLTVSGASGATNGIVTFTATSVTYTPNLNFAGADSFTYSISDGVNPPVNGTVSVTVTPVNDPPTANPDSLLVTEDTPATVNVFANDTDPDGPSSPTITGTSGGTLGTVSCAPTGGCTYTPNANANGSDSFTYTVFDGVSSSIGTVTVTITAVNDAPVANPDSGTTTTGAPIAIIVTSNDTDIDGGPLTASVSTPPANGTVACAGTTCTYTSNAGFVGTDTFTYTVSDGNGGTASATVTINVITANAPPNANDDSATTQEGQPVRINVLANDSDPNGDPLTILSFTQGTKGTVNCVAGACTYTPNPGSTGSDSFTYTIKDPSNATDTATVFINIIPCPAAPTIQSPAAGATNVPTSGNLVFSSSARDHLVFFGPAGSGCSTEYYLVSNSVTAPYSGLQAGTEYEWRVEAREPGCPRVSSACARFSTGGSCPAPPTAISPASGTSIASPVTFSWTAVSGATNYRVFISVNSAAATEIGASTTTTLVTTVPDGAIAWHVVATVPGCGEIRSTPVTFNACNAPAQPLASVIAESTSGQTYLVAWEVVPGANRYEVEEATNAAFNNSTAISTTGTSVSFTKLSNSAQPFFYRVRAFSQCFGGFGAASPTIRVVVLPPPARDDPNPNTSIPVGSRLPVTMQVFVPGEAGQTLRFNAIVDQPWMTVDPTAGTLPPAGVTLNVTVDPTALPNGTFTGTVIVTITDADTSGGRQGTNATTTKQVPLSINLVTPVLPTGSGTPPESAMIIPVVGHLDGADARWRSDVRIANTGSTKSSYLVTLVSADPAVGMKQTTLQVDPGATTALDDIVRAWYGVGSLGESSAGYLEVRPLSASGQSVNADTPTISLATVVTSRTFSQTSAGTLGEFIPAVRFGNFVGALSGGSAAQSILNLQQIAQNENFRTNVGLVEASGNPVSAMLSIFNATGTKLGDVPVELRANEQKQLNSMLAQQNLTVNDGRIEVRVNSGSGKVTAYASVVDNRSKDQLFVPAVALNSFLSSKYVVPGVADLVSGSANWRSDLRIFNPGTSNEFATLTLQPQNNSGAPLTAGITIFPGEVRVLDNVVQSVFGASNLGGAVHVTTAADTSLVVTGRTYHQTPNGNLGQFIEAVTPADGVGAGERSLNILQAEDSVRFRTNLGIAELSGKPAVVEVTISLPDSKAVPIVSIPLAANEFRQVGILRELALGNVYNARISLRVVSGEGRVSAYGSLIDMRTQDSTYVPAR